MLWHHPYGRKWRGTKEPPDQSEKGEWKSWLKTQDSENEDHGIRSHHLMANRWGNSGNSDRLYFGGGGGSKITADGDCSHEIKRRLFLGRKDMTNQDTILKSIRDITLPAKVCLVKAMVFPVVMYGRELYCKESWSPKNWCFWTVVLDKTLESPLDSKEIHPVLPKGNQSWIFIGRTDAEAETPMLCHLMWRINSLEKILMLSRLRELMMGREAWRISAVHGVAKNWTQLRDWTE